MTTTATETKEFPYLINGKWYKEGKEHQVHSPYNGQLVGTTYLTPENLLEEAIAGTVHAFGIMRKLSSGNRAVALMKIHDGIRQHRDEIGRVMAMESGKPIRDALGEVDRALLTFMTAAEEAKRLGGE